MFLDFIFRKIKITILECNLRAFILTHFIFKSIKITILECKCLKIILKTLFHKNFKGFIMTKNSTNVVVDCSRCELNFSKDKKIEWACFECKANEFKKNAVIAKKNKFYNASVGRIYYSIYIRLVYLNQYYKSEGIPAYIKAGMKNSVASLKSHEKTIMILFNTFLYSNKLTPEIKNEIQIIFRGINTCKEKRHRADYELHEIVKEKDVVEAEKTLMNFEKVYPILKGVV